MTKTQEILQSTAISYVNHLLTALFLYLAQHGLRAESLSPENLLILSGAIVAGLVSLGMMIYRKLRARILLQTAVEALAGTPIGIIESEAAQKPLSSP